VAQFASIIKEKIGAIYVGGHKCVSILNLNLDVKIVMDQSYVFMKKEKHDVKNVKDKRFANIMLIDKHVFLVKDHKRVFILN